MLLGCAAATSPPIRETLIGPPPVFDSNPDAEVTVGGEGNCPSQYEACLNKAAVDEIERRESKLQRYARDAYTLCGAPPATAR